MKRKRYSLFTKRKCRLLRKAEDMARPVFSGSKQQLYEMLAANLVKFPTRERKMSEPDSAQDDTLAGVEPLLDAGSVARVFRVCRRTAYNSEFIQRLGLQEVRLGHLRRFTAESVRNAIERATVRPVDDPTKPDGEGDPVGSRRGRALVPL